MHFGFSLFAKAAQHAGIVREVGERVEHAQRCGASVDDRLQSE
jgi:hypothetical protein